MPKVILPPIVLFNQERERLIERHGELRWFNRQLRQIDERLELVKAKENASAPGLIPGYWHVVRHNEPPAMDSYVPITGDRGEFVEPSSGWLDRFRADDSWNNGGWPALQEKWARRKAAVEREKQRAHEARSAEIADRIKALESPGVSMTDARPWTYRAGAKQ